MAEWMFRDDAAEALGVKAKTLSNLHNRGILPNRKHWPRPEGGWEFLYWGPDVEAAKDRRRQRLDTFQPEELCASCQCVLARCDPSPDSTLCYDCWDMLQDRPEPKRIPMRMPNPGYHNAGG